MRVVVAADKFAGTLTASEAGHAIVQGWKSVRPGDAVRTVPMADGGPGTVEVVAATGAGNPQTTATIDQLGRPLKARWLALGDTALIEACSACGLDLVSERERHPTTMTTAGVGRLIADANRRGFERIVVGLGGTGTVDAGVGAALELGATARDIEGRELAIGGPSDFWEVESVTAIPPLGVDLIVATDVTNPMLGPHGAARTFGPQKGANPDEVEQLERSLGHLVDVAERCLPGGPWHERPGSGAAGGLAFGLMAWAGARVTGGAEMVADLIGLREHVAWSELVITGEGSLDSQTRAGKAPAYVADVADSLGRPVVAVAGRIEPEAGGRFADAVELGEAGLSDPTGSVVRAAAQLAGRWGG